MPGTTTPIQSPTARLKAQIVRDLPFLDDSELKMVAELIHDYAEEHRDFAADLKEMIGGAA